MTAEISQPFCSNASFDFNQYLPDCYIGAYIGSGHSFVELVCDCIGFAAIVGFYPYISSHKLAFPLLREILPMAQSFMTYGKSMVSVNHVYENPNGGGLLKAPGMVVDDTDCYVRCALDLAPCKNVTLPSTPNQVLRAIEYIEGASLEGVAAFKNKNGLDDLRNKRGVYRVLSHNCIDFVRDLLKASGHERWEPKLRHNNANLNFISRIFAFGWHYFSWTT